jgi:hypothetical protein
LGETGLGGCGRSLQRTVSQPNSLLNREFTGKLAMFIRFEAAKKRLNGCNSADFVDVESKKFSPQNREIFAQNREIFHREQGNR